MRSSMSAARARWASAFLLIITVAGLPVPHVAASPTSQAAASASWHMVAPLHEGALWKVALDGGGNGWVVADDTGGGNAIRFVRLQDDRLSGQGFAFSNVTIARVILSADGATGWAVGSEGDRVHGALFQYKGGAWSRSNDPIAGMVGELKALVLDSSGVNGFALGATADNTRSYIFQLQAGRWSVWPGAIPAGIAPTAIAADPALKYVWLAGTDERGDDTLFSLRGGRWVPTPQPVGHYVIFDIAVDPAGNGWAGLDTNDEPANSPVPAGFLRLRPDGSFTLVKSSAFVLMNELTFFRLQLDARGNGWALGYRLGVGSGWPVAAVLRLEGDRITGQQYPSPAGLEGVPGQQPMMGQPIDLAISASGIAWAVTYEGILWRYGGLPPHGALPAPASPLAGTEKCFPQTKQCLNGLFLNFWQANGGLDRFGLPVTGNLIERLGDGRVYMVQYTERARFEYHPENKDARYQVLLGLLGNMLVEGRQGKQPFRPTARSTPLYFPETGHNISKLAGYWQQNGGLAVFGYPVSEEFVEKSPTDGKEYLVQYFERNRLEWHPEQSNPRYQVLLGLLGVQKYERVYGLRPF